MQKIIDRQPIQEHSLARNACIGSLARTHGIQVRVLPSPEPMEGMIATRKYVFSYRIRIENHSDQPARLVHRRWTIIDAYARAEHVQGRGVVGQQPRLIPGHVFEYTSLCPLATPWGTMEGVYTFVSDSGSRFDVDIARFYLVWDEQR